MDNPLPLEFIKELGGRYEGIESGKTHRLNVHEVLNPDQATAGTICWSGATEIPMRIDDHNFSACGYFIQLFCVGCHSDITFRLLGLSLCEYLSLLFQRETLQLKKQKYALKEKVWKNGDPFQNYLDYETAKNEERHSATGETR